MAADTTVDYTTVDYTTVDNTTVHDTLKLSYTLIPVYLRANVLIDAYHEYVSILWGILQLGYCQAVITWPTQILL